MATTMTRSALADIDKKLEQDGLDSGCLDAEKMCYLWKLYVKSEASLKASLESIEVLRQQQNEEMKEFENYAQHVRNLSTEREDMTVELAAENEQLKKDIEDLKQEVESYKNDETQEMLLQQGLEDIADGTTGEQIAYLLVERARLMDELEAEEGRGMVDTPEGPLSAQQLMVILEQERREFEEELKVQQESIRAIREQLKVTHEEEVTAMLDENEKLQGLLDLARTKINYLESERSKLKGDTDGSAAGDVLMETVTDLQRQREADIARWRQQLHTLETENRGVKDEVKMLQAELERERSLAKERMADKERQMDRLREEIETEHSERRQLEMSTHKLNSEKKAMDLKMDFMEKDMDDLRQTIKDLSTRNKSLRQMDGGDISPSNKDIEKLARSKRDVEQELEDAKMALRKEQSHVLDLEFKVKRGETVVEDQRQDFERQEGILKTKIKSLQTQLENVEEELVVAQKGCWDARRETQKDNHVVVEQLEEELTTTKAKLRSSAQDAREARDLYEEEQSRTASLRKDIQRLTESVESLEQGKQQLQNERDRVEKKLLDAARESGTNNHDTTDGAIEVSASVLRSQLEVKEHELQTAKTDLKAGKAELESLVTTLRGEVARMKGESRDQSGTEAAQLDQALAANLDLQRALSDRQAELTELRTSSERLREETNLLQSQANAQTHQRALGARDAADNAKAWDRLKELLEKIASLESSNDKLNSELEKKAQSSVELELKYSQQAVENKAQVKIAQNKAEIAERQLATLQDDLDLALKRLRNAEDNLRDHGHVTSSLDHKNEELSQLRTQLQEEKLQRALEGQRLTQAMTELSAARDLERDLQIQINNLQHKLLDSEAKLGAVRNESKITVESRHVAEGNKRNHDDQMTSLQAELDAVQLQLTKVTAKYDLQLKKYTERKTRTVTKLQRAREVYGAERLKLCQEIERLQNDLLLARTTLGKELEWKDELQRNHHKTLLEKRDLLTQLSEQEEEVREQVRKLSVLQVRTKFLEDENCTMQQRLESVVRQKQVLDRILKEYQIEKHKEELRRSMSKNAVALVSPRPNGDSRAALSDLTRQLQRACARSPNDFAFSAPLNHNRQLEAIISPRIHSPVMEVENDRLSRTLPNMDLDNDDDDDVIGDENSLVQSYKMAS